METVGKIWKHVGEISCRLLKVRLSRPIFTKSMAARQLVLGKSCGEFHEIPTDWFLGDGLTRGRKNLQKMRS